MTKPIHPVLETDKSLEDAEGIPVSILIDRMKDLGYTFVETSLEIRVYRPNGELAILAKKSHGVH